MRRITTACWVLFVLTVTAGAAPLRIVTSFYPIHIATLNVAKDVPGVEVVNLTPPLTGCLHDYQMTPDDLKKLSGASVFIVNGAGMESFLDEAIRQAPGLKIVNASEGIELIGENPHVWVSVSLAMKQVENIARGLAKIDPVHADLYRKNADAYLVQLDALRIQMHEALKDAKSRDIVTFHEAFPYFAKGVRSEHRRGHRARARLGAERAGTRGYDRSHPEIRRDGAVRRAAVSGKSRRRDRAGDGGKGVYAGSGRDRPAGAERIYPHHGAEPGRTPEGIGTAVVVALPFPSECAS